MKPVRRVLPALLLTLFAGAAVPAASAAQFSNVVVFGDSLSDAGYYRPFLAEPGPARATLVATLGRFTTNPGPVWSELRVAVLRRPPRRRRNARRLHLRAGRRRGGLGLRASTPPGFGAAPGEHADQRVPRAQRRRGRSERAAHGLGRRKRHLQQPRRCSRPGQITQAQLQTNVLGAATRRDRSRSGACGPPARATSWSSALPDIGATPLRAGGRRGQRGRGDRGSRRATTRRSSPASPRAGMRVIPVDVFTLLARDPREPRRVRLHQHHGHRLRAVPADHHASSGSAQFCYAGQPRGAGRRPAYLFADGVHPTTGAHRIIADFAESLDRRADGVLDARRGRAAHAHRARPDARRRPRDRRRRRRGRFSAFASAARRQLQGRAGGNDPQFDSDNHAYSVGVTMRASEAVTIGVALGKTKSDGTFGNDLGGFRSSENLVSVFAGAKSGGFYGSGAATISNLDFSDVAPQHPARPAGARGAIEPVGRELLGVPERGLRLRDRQALRRPDRVVDARRTST